MSNSKAVVSAIEQKQGDGLDSQEYQALETALLQTARGRSFLTEYLRRNGAEAVSAQPVLVKEGRLPPSSDTDRILQAVENLHNAVLRQQDQSASKDVRLGIVEMAKAIAKTRSEISAMRADGEHDHFSVASEEMDAIVLSTEKATNDILKAAEKIQEVSWKLREAGALEASCEDIDNHATDIYMACSFQDLTGQRTTKVVKVLQYLEARINSMIEIWDMSEDVEAAAPKEAEKQTQVLADARPDAHLLNGPQMQDAALGQDNIDKLLGDEPFAMAANEDVRPEATEGETLDDGNSEDPIDEAQLEALFS